MSTILDIYGLNPDRQAVPKNFKANPTYKFWINDLIFCFHEANPPLMIGLTFGVFSPNSPLITQKVTPSTRQIERQAEE